MDSNAIIAMQSSDVGGRNDTDDMIAARDFPANGTAADFRPAADSVGGVAVTALLCVIIGLTVSGNVLVMSAVGRLRWMRTRSNAFVFSLAAADALVGLFVMPWAVLVHWNGGTWPYGSPLCRLWMSCDVYFSTVSIVHFSCLAVDRYLAISDPFGYARLVTRGTVGAALLFSWTLPGFISFLPILNGWNEAGLEHLAPPPGAPPECFLLVNRAFALVCSCIAFYIPLAAILFCYCRIFAIARHQARRIHALQVSSGAAGPTQHTMATGHQAADGRADDEESPGRSLSRIKRDTKAAKTLATIVGGFTVCYVPFFTLNVLDPFFGHSLDSTEGHVIWTGLTWLGYCNSMINPWIYYASNRSFRAAFRAILGCRGATLPYPPDRDHPGNPKKKKKRRRPRMALMMPKWNLQSKGCMRRLGNAVPSSEPDPHEDQVPPSSPAAAAVGGGNTNDSAKCQAPRNLVAAIDRNGHVTCTQHVEKPTAVAKGTSTPC